MFLSLITPTGMRPDAFRFCEAYMKRQTYKLFEWIVVDDGETPTKCTMGQKYVRAPLWEPGINTQRPNMNLALDNIDPKSEAIVVVEDDDWYDKRYLEHTVALLKYFPLVGGGCARYYNVRVPGYKCQDNMTHCSLSQTAISTKWMKMLFEAVNSGEFYIDIQLWAKAKAKNLPRIVYADKGLSLGMKGLPGRMGLGVGHKERDYMYDPDFIKLKEWIGADASNYASMREALPKRKLR